MPSNSLANSNPEIAKQWHPHAIKNGQLTPYDVTSCSGKLVWWKCQCGNEFEKQICKMKEKCIICS
ncbi:zinc-ribbon domain-containing protein [Bacillus sp. OV166]|uniref:zinc-ribbon domain-containing protein n=1 Tax=Bacillus sp. OV166 TaxID=1882763 RepID=UPI0015C4EF82|nr:zinc-ribbon domain-containing protein [Bacillus sp. OV166]